MIPILLLLATFLLPLPPSALGVNMTITVPSGTVAWFAVNGINVTIATNTVFVNGAPIGVFGGTINITIGRGVLTVLGRTYTLGSLSMPSVSVGVDSVPTCIWWEPGVTYTALNTEVTGVVRAGGLVFTPYGVCDQSVVTASATASPNPATVNSTVSLTVSYTLPMTGQNIQWACTNGMSGIATVPSTFSLTHTTSIQVTFTSPGTYTCTFDTPAGVASVAVTVTKPSTTTTSTTTTTTTTTKTTTSTAPTTNTTSTPTRTTTAKAPRGAPPWLSEAVLVGVVVGVLVLLAYATYTHNKRVEKRLSELLSQ